MWNILKSECKRSVFNKWTLIVMGVVSVFCVIHLCDNIEARMMYFDIVKEMGQEKSIDICVTSAYENWLLFSPNTYKYTLMFVMPILAVLPYGMSYYSDLKSGYVKHVITRMPMKVYTRAKYIATFLSGGIAVTLPLLVQFLLTAIIYPMHKPYRFNGMMQGQNCFAVDFLYEHPLVYTVFRLVLVFIVAGLLATVSLLVSKYIYNLFSVFITPFVISFMLQFVVYIIDEDSISFLINLQADCHVNEAYMMLGIEILILALVTYFGFVSSKKEVY